MPEQPINQTVNIRSEIAPEAQIHSEIAPEAQIHSKMRDVFPIEVHFDYDGTIAEEDWELRGKYYFYKIDHDTHKLAKPYVCKYLVEDVDGYDNAFYSYTVLANNDIRFRSSIPVNCEYKISGER